MSATSPPSKKVLRRYILARHGETTFNKEKRVQGTIDEESVLTLDGISQAAALGIHIALRQRGEAMDAVDDDADVPSPPSSDAAVGQ